MTDLALVLLIPRIEQEYSAFTMKEGKPPNALLLHPKMNWQLKEELLAKGMMMYDTERDVIVEQFHGMNIYISTQAGDFRLGWMLP